MTLRINVNFELKVYMSVLTDVAAIHGQNLNIASFGSHVDSFPVKHFGHILSDWVTSGGIRQNFNIGQSPAENINVLIVCRLQKKHRGFSLLIAI